MWFPSDAWIRGGECAAFPINFLSRHRKVHPSCPCVGPLGAGHCFDIFHPLYRHIFFSSPFYRMLLRSKNSKSTAPLTLISMPRCVLCRQDFSASFLQAASPLWCSLASTLTHSGSSHHPDCVCFSPSAFGLSGNGKLQLQWVLVLFLKPMLILERLGPFPGMSEKLRNGRNGEIEGTILYAFTIVIAKIG